MGRRGLSDLQEAMKTICILTAVAILQFYTLVTKLSEDVPKISGKCFGVCGDQIFSCLGHGVPNSCPYPSQTPPIPGAFQPFIGNWGRMRIVQPGNLESKNIIGFRTHAQIGHGYILAHG
jgi:hypothetical protein